MTQITKGIRSILSSPVVYDTVQNIMGAHKIRKELVDEFICPKDGYKILDLGCGTAEILKYLTSDIEYWGFDINQEYIAAAQRKFGARGYFHCGLLAEADMENLPKFDRVLAIGVLHHLDDDEVKIFFSLAKKVLNPAGRVITIDPCLSKGQNSIAEFLILSDRGQNVRDSKGYTNLAQSAFLHVNGTLRNRSWIPYTHWIMECTQ